MSKNYLKYEVSHIMKDIDYQISKYKKDRLAKDDDAELLDEFIVSLETLTGRMKVLEHYLGI